MPDTANEISSVSALTFAGIVMNAIWMLLVGVARARSANRAGMTAATRIAFTGVRNRGDTRERAPLAGRAWSREYEKIKRAAAAWIARPQLKNANATTARATS